MSHSPTPLDEPTPTEQAFPLPGGYAHAVSLGFDCRVAQQFAAHGLRAAAYPFDWVITPFPALFALLDGGFDDLLNPDHLEAVPDGVKDVRYGIEFRHDHPPGPDFLAANDRVRAKYLTRSRRLLDVLEGDGPVLLVRDGLSRGEAVALTGLLARRFPRLRYNLLAFHEVPFGAAGPGAAAGPDWGLSGVWNFRVAPAARGLGHPWGLAQSYAQVFYHLGLSRVPASHRQFLFSPFIFAAEVAPPPMPPLPACGGAVVPVAVTNASPIDWPVSGHPYEVQLGYHWLRHDGSMEQFEGKRTPLPHALGANCRAVVQAAVEAPARPGRYALLWDLVVDQVAWFSQRGQRCQAVWVEVVG